MNKIHIFIAAVFLMLTVFSSCSRDEGKKQERVDEIISAVRSDQDRKYNSLHEAVSSNDMQGVKDFIRKYPKIVHSKNVNGETALFVAAREGNLEIAQLLISEDADVNEKDEDGFTPIYWASLRGNTEILKLLISEGADVNSKNADGETPLHEAAAEGQYEAAEILITNGADVNAKDNEGNTPLDLAKRKGRDSVVNLLMERGQ